MTPQSTFPGTHARPLARCVWLALLMLGLSGCAGWIESNIPRSLRPRRRRRNPSCSTGFRSTPGPRSSAACAIPGYGARRRCSISPAPTIWAMTKSSAPTPGSIPGHQMQASACCSPAPMYGPTCRARASSSTWPRAGCFTIRRRPRARREPSSPTPSVSAARVGRPRWAALRWQINGLRRPGPCRPRSAASMPPEAIRCRRCCRPDRTIRSAATRCDWAGPSILIHGTNKPAGIGMRVSHGCIQLYPEDIAPLFAAVPVGTPAV